MKIAVVGAGNIGLAMVGYMSVHSSEQIVLFTEKNILQNDKLQIKDFEEDKIYTTNHFVCSSDPIIAFKNADVIFVTYPAPLRKKFVEKYQKYFEKGSFLGFVPGYGGIEYSCIQLVKRGVNIFGFQRVPYVSRANVINQNYEASILSKKSQIYIGCIPHANTNVISKIIENLLDIPANPLKEYLSITLAPSNPLLHTVGLYNVFKDVCVDKVFESHIGFYDKWNDEASELLFKYDEELQNICRALYPIDMSEVVSLPCYYDSLTPNEMTKKLKSIEAFKKVLVPLKREKDSYYIDLNSRMFTEDFPYGVCVIKDFAKMTGVDTPTVDMLLKFYERLSGHKYYNEDGSYTEEIVNTGIPGINGLNTIEDIKSFYHKEL